MTFKRGKGPIEAKFSIGLNIVLAGSKNMTDDQINAVLPTPAVHVTIVARDNPDLVLVDEVVAVREFTSGNVGFGLHTRGLEFQTT